MRLLVEFGAYVVLLSIGIPLGVLGAVLGSAGLCVVGAVLVIAGCGLLRWITRATSLVKFDDKRDSIGAGWMCNLIKDKIVLDVGCVGRDFSLHAKLARDGHAKSLLGIDVNSRGISEMQCLGYNVMRVDAEIFTVPDKFDVVIMSKSISHLNNVGLALDCAHDNLRADGKLVIVTDNARFLGFTLNETIGDDHNFIWSPGILSYLLGRHGFKVNGVRFFDYRSHKPNLMGRIYEGVFIKLFPRYTKHFGVVAVKVAE